MLTCRDVNSRHDVPIHNVLICVGVINNRLLFVSFQTAFVRGHRRTPSDIEFKELTRRDAQTAMNKELQKLIATAPPGLQQVE